MTDRRILSLSGLTAGALVLAASLTASGATPAPLTVNPLKVERAGVAAARGATVLSVDARAYQALKGFDRAVFPAVALDAQRALSADLELEKFSVFTEETRFVEVTEQGEVDLPLPDIQLWRGKVRGDAESKVFLAITPASAQGYIATGGETFIVSAGEKGEQPTLIFGSKSDAAANVNIANLPCAGGLLAPGTSLPERPNTGNEPNDRAAYVCKRFNIAIETDNEFRTRLGGTTQAQNYIATLLGADSEIYQRDVAMKLNVSYARIWTVDDPWTAANTGAQLDQFVSYWNTNMGSVQRDLAHMLSTRGLGGGIAYINATCSGFGYGVSANLNGSFPYPLINNNGGNWDVNVVAHELGHNFGTGHTHESNWYNPIIDGCGLAYVGGVQDCSQAFALGSVMSYCHLCPGGMANIKLDFGPRVEATIRGWVDGGGSGCGVTLPRRLTNPVGATFEEGDPVNLSASFETFGPATYQWRRNNVNLVPGGRFTGVNSPTLTISPSQPGDSGQYTLAITADCGNLVSLAGTVVVNQTCPNGQSRPTITQSPSSVNAVTGQNVGFTVAATGTGTLNYRWRKGTTDLADGGRFAGTGTPSMAITGVLESDAGQYNCEVTGPQCTTVSALATLAVTPPPPAPFNLTTPANGATQVPVNSSLLMNWDTSVGATSYTFVIDNNSDFSSPVAQVSDLTSPGLSVSPGTLQQATTYFWKVTATNPFGTTESTPAAASFRTFTPATNCRADWSGDGAVNTIDLAIFLGRFGTQVGPFGVGDTNGDGLVNTADLVAVLSEFGTTNCGG